MSGHVIDLQEVYRTRAREMSRVLAAAVDELDPRAVRRMRAVLRLVDGVAKLGRQPSAFLFAKDLDALADKAERVEGKDAAEDFHYDAAAKTLLLSLLDDGEIAAEEAKLASVGRMAFPELRAKVAQ